MKIKNATIIILFLSCLIMAIIGCTRKSEWIENTYYFTTDSSIYGHTDSSKVIEPKTVFVCLEKDTKYHTSTDCIQLKTCEKIEEILREEADAMGRKYCLVCKLHDESRRE